MWMKLLTKLDRVAYWIDEYVSLAFEEWDPNYSDSIRSVVAQWSSLTGVTELWSLGKTHLS